jgi:hypothetical protein
VRLGCAVAAVECALAAPWLRHAAAGHSAAACRSVKALHVEVSAACQFVTHHHAGTNEIVIRSFWTMKT